MATRKTTPPKRSSNGVRVRIGNASQTVPTGRNTYVIRYRTTRQIGFFEKFDELYWNATGTGWTFPIDVAEARITLPEKVDFTQTAVYTGPQGATGKNATIVEQRPGTIVFRTTQPLPARNGLTVAAAWPKGIITPPIAGATAAILVARQPAGGGGRRSASGAVARLFRVRLAQGRTRSARAAR